MNTSKFIAAILIVAGSVSQSWAAQSLDRLLACRGMADSAARLDCFDRAADAAVTTKQADAPVTAPEAGPVKSSIVQISQPLNALADFTLENGQVWRQMDAEKVTSAKRGDRVTISKKLLGAYWLKVDGGRAWRVTLIR